MVNGALGPTSEVTTYSPARTARVAPRHAWLAMVFVAMVVVPVAAAAIYLFFWAKDQFASTVAFSVRREEVVSPVELLGGIADMAGSGSADADILFDYLNSQDIVQALDVEIGLSEMFSGPADDPFFVYRSGGSIEDLHAYWQRMVRVIYDPRTGIIDVRALAFHPEDARLIASAVLEKSSNLIDEISAIAQADTTDFARTELDTAVERLKLAREQLTAFRSRTQIVDPTADLQGQMGILSMLEQQLASALIDADLLRESTRASDPRLTQADRRITVIEARIADERRKLGVGGQGGSGRDYATLMAEYERLAVDLQFAEETYRAALTAFDLAQADARRKSRYLVAHIKPTLAETSQHPRRMTLLAGVAAALFGAFAVVLLFYYSVRDRR